MDLTDVHLPAFVPADAVPAARDLFDARAAAAVSATVAIQGIAASGPVQIWPSVEWAGDQPINGSAFFAPKDLLEMKWYENKGPTVYHPTAKSLSALAYLDFFPDDHRVGRGLRTLVSGAVLAASPGWVGTNGPGVTGLSSLGDTEGNYDMTEMHLIVMAYQFFGELSPAAREFLIEVLLQNGRIQRPNLDDTFTSGRAPNDWSRAGYIAPVGLHKDMGETENHILMIATARYLTNQLLYQRDHDWTHDNRRNGGEDWTSCLEILLTLLRNMLRDDFSEYNAKGYQAETRWALLNLCTYAYDHEVRLAARMVLDYISARIAVSTNDLRRMVPFRRRNDGDNSARDASGFMTVGLLESRPGADPMSPYFAMQAGNTRAYEASGSWPWAIKGSGDRLATEVLSDYRLPHSIHDLFVNDLHRRFFQRLHRVPRNEVQGANRNADNMEIYAGSPSYLITAGGSPSGYAIDPYFGDVVFKASAQRQQLGVAVTTSFMPTGSGQGDYLQDSAGSLIQLGGFDEGPASKLAEFQGPEPARNYGVAPDFLCGHNLHLPSWVPDHEGNGFFFVDRSGRVRAGWLPPGGQRRPGFYLAICRQGNLATVEALDTWLHPGVSMPAFQESVLASNGKLRLAENEEFQYTTWNGNRLHAVIWSHPTVELTGHLDSAFGAEVRRIEYGGLDPSDAIGDAGNVTGQFLNGTVLNSPEEAVVEITNPFLGTTITLDMRDQWRPRRVSETGETEEAGPSREVWLDFEWRRQSEGDVCRPFSTIAAATAAVADGGMIRILPGSTTERAIIGHDKRMRLVAPLGGVVLGRTDGRKVPGDGPAFDDTEAVAGDDVWVEFDFPSSSAGHIAGPFNNLVDAAAAVADDGLIRIVPGRTSDRRSIGSGKRFRLAAPMGQVTIGAKA